MDNKMEVDGREAHPHHASLFLSPSQRAANKNELKRSGQGLAVRLALEELWCDRTRQNGVLRLVWDAYLIHRLGCQGRGV